MRISTRARMREALRREGVLYVLDSEALQRRSLEVQKLTSFTTTHIYRKRLVFENASMSLGASIKQGLSAARTKATQSFSLLTSLKLYPKNLCSGQVNVFRKAAAANLHLCRRNQCQKRRGMCARSGAHDQE